MRTLPLYTDRRIWKNSACRLIYVAGGGGWGSQFPRLGVPQRKDMKHVKRKKQLGIPHKPNFIA